MSTPVFNASATNGLSRLEFVNSGMSSLLSASGNTVSVTVGVPEPRTVEAAPVGGNWTISRTAGVGPRRIVWDVLLKCASEANLNTVESKIEAYLLDGRAYDLTDGRGRSTTYAVLVGSETRREGRRVRTLTGWLQRWRLVFSVLSPQVGGSAL